MDFALPPSANWFCSAIISVSEDGRVAYGSKNQIIILDASVEKDSSRGDEENWRENTLARKPKLSVVNWAFADKTKVTGISWTNSGKSLVACSDDGHVKLFAMESGGWKCIKNHTAHKELSRDRHKITCLACSPASQDLVFSGDEAGNMVIWDVKDNTTRHVNIVKKSILSIACHPNRAELVAFGHKQGLAHVVNTCSGNAGKIVHRFRGHDDDINGVAWSPALSDGQFGTDPDDQLLAVGSHDRSISIWSFKTGRQVANLKVTTGSKSWKQLDVCMAVNWAEHSRLLTTGAQNELVEWDLGSITTRNAQGVFVSTSPSILHREHSRQLYSIAVGSGRAYTVGFERILVAYDLDDRRLAFNVPTFASVIFSFEPNYVDPSILAIGAGDGQIRVWKMASAKSTFEVSTIFVKQNVTKIMALAWHPTKDNLLAFGTDEGRIGTVDALSPKPTVNMFVTQHRSAVYKLAWGPPIGQADGSEEEELRLYSVGDGNVIIHPPRKVEKKAVAFDELIGTKEGEEKPVKKFARTEIAFEPTEKKFFAVGSDDGTVEVFALPCMKLACVLKSHHKLVQCLAWLPENGQSDKPGNLLAVSSNEHDIHVWKMTDVLSKCDMAAEKANVFVKPDHVLSGHHARVVHLVWSSPGDEFVRLLSTSYDGSAQIWEFSAGEEARAVANYPGHIGRVIVGLWNPVDTGSVLTGGDDSSIHSWKISDQSQVLPVKKANNGDKKAVLQERKSKKAVLTDGSREAATNGQVLEADENGARAHEAKVVGGKKKSLQKVIFSKSTGAEATSVVHEDCLDLLAGLENLDVESKPHLGLFGDAEVVGKLLDLEVAAMEEKEKLSSYEDLTSHYVHTWTGNGARSVRIAIDEGRITEWHVNVASSCSHGLWEEACRAYATKLAKNGNVIKAASYYLMIRRAVDAVEVLKQHGYFRAAVAIAKTNLPNDSPIIQDLYESWASKAVTDGLYDLSAKCWMAAGDFAKAADKLSKKSDGQSLAVASQLLSKAGDEEKARILAFQAAEAFKASGDEENLKKFAASTPFGDVKQSVEL